MIYFVESNGRIKIGHTENLAARMGKLASDCPWPPKLLGVTDGGVEYEDHLHKRFSHVRVHGEWFLDCPEIRLEVRKRCYLPKKAEPQLGCTLKTYLAAERGRGARLAEHLGLAHGTITQWTVIPSQHVRDIAAFTGLDVVDLLPPARAVTPATMDIARYEEALESSAPQALP